MWSVKASSSPSTSSHEGTRCQRCHRHKADPGRSSWRLSRFVRLIGRDPEGSVVSPRVGSAAAASSRWRPRDAPQSWEWTSHPRRARLVRPWHHRPTPATAPSDRRHLGRRKPRRERWHIRAVGRLGGPREADTWSGAHSTRWFDLARSPHGDKRSMPPMTPGCRDHQSSTTRGSPSSRRASA